MNSHQHPCIYATKGAKRVLVAAHPQCPEHGDGERWQVVEVPAWLTARLKHEAA